MKWVMERDIFDEDMVGLLIEEIKRQGHECVSVQYVPFQSGNLSAFCGTSASVFYGSLNLAHQIIHDKENAIKPLVFYDTHGYACTSYYPFFRKWLLNYPYVMFPFVELGEAKFRKWLFDCVGSDGCMFVRPNSGAKTFTGQVITEDTWDKDQKRISFYEPEPQSLVIASAPQNIVAEWRFVVCDDRVITGSKYRDGRNLVRERCDEGLAFEFAQTVVIEVGYTPDRVWTMDICEKVDGGLRVLEIGSFSCSGLYGCNPEVIVREVSRVVAEERETFG